MKGQDLCERRFDAVRVPRENLLGAEEGRGLGMLMQALSWERLMISISAVASARAALDDSIAYARERKNFGRSLAALQNTRFKLAEMKAEIEIAQVFIDRCVTACMERGLSPELAAAAKFSTTELPRRVVDDCLQLHGSHGYMLETPIARTWLDARVSRIHAGSNEIMKELVARFL